MRQGIKQEYIGQSMGLLGMTIDFEDTSQEEHKLDRTVSETVSPGEGRRWIRQHGR